MDMIFKCFNSHDLGGPLTCLERYIKCSRNSPRNTSTFASVVWHRVDETTFAKKVGYHLTVVLTITIDRSISEEVRFNDATSP